MGNWSGIVIIGVAVVLVIMGIQGSWSKFFPWIMSTGSSSPTYPNAPTQPGGGCPPGYTLINGQCVHQPNPRSGV